MSQAPRLALHHVGVSVADLDRSRKWYAQVLGFTEGFAFEIPPAGLRGLFMIGNGFRVELLERRGSMSVRGAPDPVADLLTRGYGHFAMETAELDADFARLVAAGATPVWEPRPSPEPGIRMAFIADADGNLIELVEGKDL
jgi:catechol 2,3-dioxygenase-like lactoylglutathione lyase family enzyme